MDRTPESIENARAAMTSMQEAMRRTVLAEMRPAQELAELAGREAHQMRRELERWSAEGRILSVHHEGVDYFSQFALNPGYGYRPYPAAAEAIRILRAVLDPENSWGVASWFLGVNSFLDDQRPADLLGEDPEWVIEAAREEVNNTRNFHG